MIQGQSNALSPTTSHNGAALRQAGRTLSGNDMRNALEP